MTSMYSSFTVGLQVNLSDSMNYLRETSSIRTLLQINFTENIII